MKAVKSRVPLLMAQQDIKPRQLIQMTGLTSVTISKWRDRSHLWRRIDVITALKIANALQCKFEELFETVEIQSNNSNVCR